MGRTKQCRENSKDVARKNVSTVEGKWKIVTLCRTALFMYVAAVFWEANWGGKPLTTHVTRMKWRRKRNETLVGKPPRKHHKKDRGGHERTSLGYSESDSGSRPKVNFCICYYIVRLQQDRIGITHTQTHIHIYKPTECGPGSSVGIATDYGLDGLVSNPGGDEIFRPWGPPSPL